MTLADLTTRSGHPCARARRVYHDTLTAARFVGIPWRDAHIDALNNARADWQARYPDRVVQDQGQDLADVDHERTLQSA